MDETTLCIQRMAAHRLMYHGVPVCTTKQLAEVYGTSEKNIQMNFSNNSARFEEGKHYFYLEGDELQEFRKLHTNDIGVQPTDSWVQISSMARSLYLWTERGANRHCKILDTDNAWEQFDNLEEVYFRVKTGQIGAIAQETRLALDVQVRSIKEASEILDLSMEEKVDALRKLYESYGASTAFLDFKRFKTSKREQGKTVIDFLGRLQTELISGRYVLLPKMRTNDFEYIEDGQVFGLYDRFCYYLRGKMVADFYREFFPDQQVSDLYSALYCLNILDNARDVAGPVTVEVYYRKHHEHFLKIPLRDCPIPLTTLYRSELKPGGPKGGSEE